MSLTYYVIDLETNGLSIKHHSVIEIGIIRASDKVQLTRNVKCETPQNSSFDALAITGKTLADLSLGLSKEEAVEECDKFLNEDGLKPEARCIIGHNIISFDKRFLFALWESVGKAFPASLWLDTLQMSKAYVKQLGLKKQKTNLHSACDLVGIKKLAGIHNAKSDSRNTFLLWKNLIEDKKMDYLPFIKSFPHTNSANLPSDSEMDDLLDLNDV